MPTLSRRPAHLVVLGLVALWTLAELAPLIPSIDFEGIKNSLKPLLLSPRFDIVVALFEAAQVLLLGHLLRQVFGSQRGTFYLTCLLGLVVIGKLLVRGQSLDWSLASGFALGLALWVGILAPQYDRRAALHVVVIATVAYTAFALAPFQWRPASAFAWWPFSGSLGGGMLVNARALAATTFVLAGVVLLIRRLSPAPWPWVFGLAGWVLVLEIAQLWVVNRSAGSTEPLLVLAAMWLFSGNDEMEAPAVMARSSRAVRAGPDGFTRVALIGGAVLVAIAISLAVTLSMPGIPYNVTNLFRHGGSLPILLTFALALMWIGAGPIWLGQQLSRSPRPFVWLPVGLMTLAVVGFVLLNSSVTFESLADALGISHRPGLFGTLDHFIRYTALYSPLALALALCVVASEPVRLPFVSWIVMAVEALLWLWLCRVVTIDWALTDNLTELISTGGRLGVPGLFWLYGVVAVLAGTVVVAVRCCERRRYSFAILTLLAAIPVTWLLLKAGLQARIEKYGVTFSALQFLLGPDRQHTLPESVLFFRWSLVFFFLVLAIGGGALFAVRAFGGWAASRHGTATLRHQPRGDEATNLPVIDATPPRPAPAAGQSAGRKPMLRNVPLPGRTAPAAPRPKLIRRMPSGSTDPRRRDSH
jgi:hypothetical protein